MADKEEVLAGIRANADLVVEQFGATSGLEHFGFDAPSVEWLDGFIERQRVRDDIGPEFIGKMVGVLGSYLGECIIRTYGGRWALVDGAWRIELDEKNAAYPFTKVHKQFENGAEDSIYSFFTVIPAVFPALGRPSPPRPHQPPPPTRDTGWLARIRRWLGRDSDR